MRKIGVGFLVTLVSIFIPVVASAAVVNFTEVGGNLDYPSGVSVGVLDIGNNSVSGSLAGTCVAGDCNSNPSGTSGNSQDSFSLTVANGTQITGIFVTTSNVSGPAGFSASFSFSDPFFPSEVFVPFLPLGATSGNLLDSAVGPETWRSSMFGQGASADGLFSLDYQITYVVTAVPIPAAAWLFGSALFGLVGVARRKQA